MVFLLVRNGASVDAKDSSERTPLFAAASAGHNDVVRALIKSGASANDKDEDGNTALHGVAQHDLADMARTLIEMGASVHEKNGFGESPLFFAVRSNHFDVVATLLESGASVHDKNDNDESPLFAVHPDSGCSRMVRTLVAHGAAVDDKNWAGDTPLIRAITMSHTHLASALIANGASVHEKSKYGQTALCMAALFGPAEMANILIRNGASVDQANRTRETPLILAGQAGKMDIFKALIEAGASVDVRDSEGGTPLISASTWDYFPGVQLLISRGCWSGPEDVSEDEYPLLPGTFEKMASMCAETVEFERMSGRVVERLQEVHSQLQQIGASHVQEDARATFVTIVFRFCRLLVHCQSKENSVVRFIASRAISSRIQDCHEELDHFIKFFSLKESGSSWKAEWEGDLARQQLLFQEILSTDEVFAIRDSDDAAVRLQNELRNRSGKNGPDALKQIEAVLRRLLRVKNIEAPSVYEWFISRDDVEFENWNIVGSDHQMKHYDGTWLKTKVRVATYSMHFKDFLARATKWYPLSHPNVLKLYGGCHLDTPYFFVYEYYPEGGSLREFLLAGENHTRSVWKHLYEASLGLQYLHQRNVVHGDLRCHNIVVGSDLKAKITGFGLDHAVDYAGKNERAHWEAPEYVQDGSSESVASDIISFGVCILEAVVLERASDGEDGKIIHAKISNGELPERPAIMSDAQWDLVTKMCAFDPNERVNIVYVVNQLRHFAFDRDDHSSLNEQETAAASAKESQHLSIEEYVFPELSATISAALENILVKCNEFPESEWMVEKVYTALAYIFDRLRELEKGPTDAEVAKYCSILSRVQGYLRRAVSEKSIAQFARSRKVAETHHVIYAELDRLLDMLGVSEADSIRSWERSHQDVERRVFGSDTTAFECERSGSSGKSEAVSVIHFESPPASSSDPNSASGNAAWTQAGLSALTTTPSWYLPLLELVFSESDRIGQGAFGAVYKGTWLDTPVVVKFMGYEEDAGTISTNLLLHEIRMWHQLNHPHIVRLYGACHVDKRYFVCEYASNGDLQEFLKVEANKHLTWQKMHEVALGLEYLHGQNIVHNDLKCDNVLIGMDGKAKLIDFGLSCLLNVAEIQVSVKQMGAVHWKSPEYLTGGRPSFASDVYSFAMCVLEAVTGDIPWGKQTNAVFVKFQVKKGRIPALPDALNEKQRNLIELMTRSEPLERVKMSFVADKLFEISQDEAVSAAVP